MQARLHILFFVPITAVFAVNTIALYIAESHLILALNVITYMSVVSISLLFLGNFCDKLHKNLKQISENMDTVSYSANLLKEVTDPGSLELKNVLIACREQAMKSRHDGRGYLVIARELALAIARVQEVNTYHANMSFFVSDCISKKSDQMSAQLRALGIDTQLKKKKVRKKPLPDESPLKAGALRHSIRLAEKRLAA
jgi:hypothetical protein